MTDDAEIRALVALVGSGELVTNGPDGYPLATRLPLLRTGDRVTMHMARANPHWQHIGPDAWALLIVTGPEAYISPSWYAAKAAHGRVVPTWNYSAVHLMGSVRVHEDPAWLLTQVSQLSDVMESGRAEPWAVADAPEDFIAQQMRGIVGVELAVDDLERLVPDPQASDYIFWWDRHFDAQPTPAQIVDRILAYQPFAV
jgi:transcriptional regulator